MQGSRRRGQPLVILGVVLMGWALVRAAAWELPPGLPAMPLAAEQEGVPAARAWRLAGPEQAQPETGRPAVFPTAPDHLPLSRSAPPPLPVPLFAKDVASGRRAEDWPDAAPSPLPPAPVPQRVAVGHALLLAAGLAQMDVPPALLALLRPPAAPVSAAPAARLVNGRRSRWSADGWIMLRQDGAAGLAAARPAYGRSQAGAVVRYRLADSAMRPEVYLRASSALSGATERELASGLSVRVAHAVPLRLQAEARAADRGGRVATRPAVLAVTELAPARLPFAARGDAYVQAGYVGGAYATPFVDGQARIDRALAGQGASYRLHAGGGAWGGAQKGSARLDIGPTAGLEFGAGQMRSRLSVDYRFRVAGNAMPASGPAITLSAGF